MSQSTHTCIVCGGELESIGNGMGKCTFCRSKQSMPVTDSKKLERANKIRREFFDFSKALSLYEEIMNESPDEAEAYWGAAVCRYGIEFVEDNDGTAKPTCHRTIETSFADDPDFKTACEKASEEQKEYYISQAQIIDEIQKKILDIVRSEEPYDVFISYKATDDDGNPTPDSKEAQKLFYKLKNEGYKVFFSEDTLQHKAGTEYEPVIYAALKTAPVMLLIGSCEQNLNAKWVKNEWRRYLDMTKTDEGKTMIVIYYDMDAYDLPSELRQNQAVNWKNAEAMNIILEAVEKYTDGDIAKSKYETEITKAIEGREFEKASIKYNTALNMYQGGHVKEALRNVDELLSSTPDYHEGYWLRLCMRMGFSPDNIANQQLDFSSDPDYISAVSNADEKNKEKYESIMGQCLKNIKRQQDYNAEFTKMTASYHAMDDPEKIDVEKKKELEKFMFSKSTLKSFTIYKRPKKELAVAIAMLALKIFVYIRFGQTFNALTPQQVAGYEYPGLLGLLVLLIVGLVAHIFISAFPGAITGIASLYFGWTSLIHVTPANYVEGAKFSIFRAEFFDFLPIAFLIFTFYRNIKKAATRNKAQKSLDEYRKLLYTSAESLKKAETDLYNSFAATKEHPDDLLIEYTDGHFERMINEKLVSAAQNYQINIKTKTPKAKKNKKNKTTEV